MKRETLWKIIVKQNPALKSGKVSVTAGQLRRLFDLTWDKATRQSQSDNHIHDLFGRMGL